MKKFTILFTVFLLVVGCLPRTEGPLIYEKFHDQETFLIACRGNAKEGTMGIARFESAKRAALMNVYYFIRLRFDSTVIPERDGSIDRVERAGDSVVVHYVVKKRGLKSRAR